MGPVADQRSQADRCSRLFAGTAFGGHLVFDDRFGDGEGEAVLVVGALDEELLRRDGREASFEKNGGVFDAGDDGVAGTADATVAAAGVFDDG